MNDYYLYILITLMVANVKTKTLKGTLEKIEKDKKMSGVYKAKGSFSILFVDGDCCVSTSQHYFWD